MNLNLNLPPDYKLTENEKDNLIYLSLRYTIDWTMRAADKQVVLFLAGGASTGKDIERLVKVACEYAWDHLAGKPLDGSPESYYEYMVPILESWYKTTTQQERDVI